MTELKDRDHGYRELFVRLKKLKGGGRVTVGVHEAEGSAQAEGGDGEATLLDVATFAEFGTVTEPARSFIRDWSDEKEEENRVALGKIMQAVAKGTVSDLGTGLRRFGAFAVASCQRRMVAGIDPPNAPSTIERKGSSTPLIDKGQLKRAITSVVE